MNKLILVVLLTLTLSGGVHALSSTDLNITENTALHFMTGATVSLYAQHHFNLTPLQAFLTVVAIALSKEYIDDRQGLGFNLSDSFEWMAGSLAVSINF